MFGEVWLRDELKKSDLHTCWTISGWVCLISAPEKFLVSSTGFQPMTSIGLVSKGTVISRRGGWARRGSETGKFGIN